MVKDLADLYSLTKEQLLTLEGSSRSIGHLLMESIERSKSVTLERLLMGLGILSGWTAYCQGAGQAVRHTPATDGRHPRGVPAGPRDRPEISASLASFFSEGNRDVIDRLVERGLTIEAPAAERGADSQTLAAKPSSSPAA